MIGRGGAGARPVAPLGSEAVAIEPLVVAGHRGVPNHPSWPALIIPGAVPQGASADAIAALYNANGWFGTWVWTVFAFHHFHPDAAEVLTVVEGRAILHLGGPDGVLRTVTAGDVLVLPPGFGHKRVSSDPGFAVVGGYPAGQENYSTLKPGDADLSALHPAIGAVPRPPRDPIWGANGPLLLHWQPVDAGPQGAG